MSVTITFGTTTSPKNALTKTYTSRVSLTGNLKDDTSVYDPVLLVNANLATLAGCNYMYIATYGRYYYITDIVSKGANLVEVHGHCDVLKTYASGIRACTGYVSRTGSGNGMITDEMKMLTNKPTVTTYQTTGGTPFDSKTNEAIILVTACSTTPSTPSSHSSSSHSSESNEP